MAFEVSIYTDCNTGVVLDENVSAESSSNSVCMNTKQKTYLIKCRNASVKYLVSEINRIIRFIAAGEYSYLALYLPTTRLHKFKMIDWEDTQ